MPTNPWIAVFGRDERDNVRHYYFTTSWEVAKRRVTELRAQVGKRTRFKYVEAMAWKGDGPFTEVLRDEEVA